MPEWYRINQVKLRLDQEFDALPRIIAEELKLEPSQIQRCIVRRKSLDARGRRRPSFIMNVDFLWAGDPMTIEERILGRDNLSRVIPPHVRQIVAGEERLVHRPVVAGTGPAGLMAALRLAEAGYCPLILERGDGLAQRIQAVERFWNEGVLDPECNIQFGAGGAGTFSDGKLVTRIKDPLALDVLETLTELGAHLEITYEAKPHVGTDRLRGMVAAWEERISRAGGEFQYRTRISGPVIRDGRLAGVKLSDGSQIPADVLVLATGHSAREIYQDCMAQGLVLEARPIAVGFRVEHPQVLVDRSQYGTWAGEPRLGAADYRLTHHYAAGNRGVYSFCMCPGGMVVAAASEPDGVVTNGMSFYDRDSGIANSAIVAAIRPDEYDGDGRLAGGEFQRYWERKAFQLGGGDYKAPGQRVADFLAGVTTKQWTDLTPTYRPGVLPTNLDQSLPPFIVEAIRDGLRRFEQLIPGFARQGVLTGVETRTSSPVRINRRDDLQAERAQGVYPCGEGSGYAGGIVSAAVDGLRAAEAVILRYKPFEK